MKVETLSCPEGSQDWSRNKPYGSAQVFEGYWRVLTTRGSRRKGQSLEMFKAFTGSYLLTSCSHLHLGSVVMLYPGTEMYRDDLTLFTLGQDMSIPF